MFLYNCRKNQDLWKKNLKNNVIIKDKKDNNFS